MTPEYIESVADFTPERADLSIGAPEPTPPAPPAFDAARVARIARGHEAEPRRTAVEEAVRLAEIAAARKEEQATRAEEAHIATAVRRQEVADARKAERDRINAMSGEEIADRVRGRRR